MSEELGCNEQLVPREAPFLVRLSRTYTELGQVATATDGAGNVVTSEYDAVGRLRAISVSGGSGAAQRKQFRYDANGNQTEAVDELGYSLVTAYDDYDRPILSDAADRGPASTVYTVASNTWVATTTTSTGEVVSTATDAMGRQVRTCAADGICIQDIFTDGLLTRRTRTGAGTPAALLGTRYYQYYPNSARLWREWDWLSFAESQRCPGTAPDDCEVPHVEHGYTAAGRAATFRDRQGNLTTYGYQAANRSMLLTRVRRNGLPEQTYTYNKDYPILERRSIIGTDGGGTITEDTEWARNLRPAVIRRTDGKRREAITFRYDGAGRQTFAQVTRPEQTVAVRETFDAHGRPLTRAYDISAGGVSYTGTIGLDWRANGQLAGVSYPSGNKVTYEYDKSTGRLQSVVAGGASVFEAQNFDASGRARTLRLDGGSIEVARTYDSAGREQARTIDGVASGPRRETYGYDSHGRLSTIVATEGAAATNTVYGYDPRDRLISETHTAKDGTTRSFTYDYDRLTGLRATKSDSNSIATTTTAYAYDSGNRLASVDGAPIAWDGYGRQVGDASGRTFRWGLADQLDAIDQDGANLETSWHDATGLRVARRSVAGVEFFLAGDGGELLERRPGGDAGGIVDYVRLPGGTVVATIDQNGWVTPVLSDITGSPYRIGAFADKEHHYEDTSGFGEVIKASGILDEPLAFHQMLAGEADGILLAGVRAYDLTTGRFLSADPMELAAAPSAIDAADFFRYAQDNPIAMQDATGLAPCLMTPEGGCRSNLGEETYEEQRQAAMEHYAANEPEMRALQEQANEYWEIRNPTTVNLEKVTEASDGQVAEASKSTDARPPAAMETPTEPAKKVTRAAKPRRHARARKGGEGGRSVRRVAGKSGDEQPLEVVVHGSTRKHRRVVRLLGRDEHFAGATEEELGLWADAYLDWKDPGAWQAVIDYYQGLSASDRLSERLLSRQAMGRFGKALAHWGEGEYAAAYANALAAGILPGRDKVLRQFSRRGCGKDG